MIFPQKPYSHHNYNIFTPDKLKILTNLSQRELYILFFHKERGKKRPESTQLAGGCYQLGTERCGHEAEGQEIVDC